MSRHEVVGGHVRPSNARTPEVQTALEICVSFSRELNSIYFGATSCSQDFGWRTKTAIKRSPNARRCRLETQALVTSIGEFFPSMKAITKACVRGLMDHERQWRRAHR